MQSSYTTYTGTATRLHGGISPKQIREIVLTESKRAGVGHIGSALSIADILAVLYGSILRIAHLNDPDRDRFILSKGHAALALYAVLYLKGWISADELHTYCADGSRLGVHPEHVTPGVDFSTGSLGQGLSFGVGAAYAARLQQSRRRVFVLMSDAELNEGSVWEAIMFAAHHQLSNLVAIIDLNGQQAFGYTKDVLHLPRLTDRFTSFGWDAHNVDGHNIDKLASIMNGCATTPGAPHMIIAHTVFGKGVSFMERQIKWHYSPMSDNEYQDAILEVQRAT